MNRLLLATVLILPTLAVAQGKPCQCPVTRLTIPSPKAAVGQATYKGKTYYFCTTNCQKLFKKSPAKYAK